MKICYSFFSFFILSFIKIHGNLSPILSDGVELTKKYIQFYAPKALELWEECQKKGIESYINYPLDNCSIKGHIRATKFQKFIENYLKGDILDIGCGPEYIPLYLENYNVSKIVGLDPLGLQEDHPFIFYKGFAEYLPWENDTFDTVVVATSLDHVILLDKVISEIFRVLKKDGYFIIWTDFRKEATKYNPYNNNLKSYDDYHLFHFTKKLFEETFADKFTILANLDVSVNENFYVFIPKNLEKNNFIKPDELLNIINN